MEHARAIGIDILAEEQDAVGLREIAEHAKAKAALDRVRPSSTSKADFSPETLERFARALHEALDDENGPLRCEYLRAVIEQAQVDDHVIRISGNVDRLARAIQHGRATQLFVSFGLRL